MQGQRVWTLQGRRPDNDPEPRCGDLLVKVGLGTVSRKRIDDGPPANSIFCVPLGQVRLISGAELLSLTDYQRKGQSALDENFLCGLIGELTLLA